SRRNHHQEEASMINRSALLFACASLLMLQVSLPVNAAPAGAMAARWQKEAETGRTLIYSDPLSAANHMNKALDLVQSEKVDPKDPAVRQLLLYDVGELLTALALKHKEVGENLARSESDAVRKMFGP